RSRLMQPELVKEFIAGFHEEMNRMARASEQEVHGKRREFDQVRRKLAGLIDAIAEGYRSEDLQANPDALEARKAALQTELDQAPPSAPRFHPNLAELYRRQVERLHEALADSSIREEALEILRSLVEAVILRPLDSGFEVELVGDIAKMIMLPGKPGNSVPDMYRSSVKVVAGARNRSPQRSCGLPGGIRRCGARHGRWQGFSREHQSSRLRRPPGDGSAPGRSVGNEAQRDRRRLVDSTERTQQKRQSPSNSPFSISK
ncbi:MAG: hypothetical protein IH857_07390, partial [Deltaproteobacteria bacterium]|nr:hypothetical protein [Deltaproteobacteria bacterium]